MKLESLFELYSAGEVERLHTIRTIHRQTIAEHSFGVALLLMWVHLGSPPSSLMEAAILHDLPERDTGDIPGNVKWSNPDIGQSLEVLEDEYYARHGIKWFLTESEKKLFNFIDRAELAMYCLAEMNMGNKHYSITVIVSRVLAKLEEDLRASIFPLPPRCRDLYIYIHNRWMELTQ